LPEREEKIEMNDRPHPGLLPQEKVKRPPRLGVARAGWIVAALACLMLFSSAAFANDVITNIMSPIASYQYPDNFSTAALTNGGIMSPIVSYQYYEWPGSGILNLQYSPTVSYYYQFLDAPVLNIVQTNRTPTANEITPQLAALPTTSQLLAFNDYIFTTNLASVDPNQPTIVLTHSWIPSKNGTPVFTQNGVADWPTTMAKQLRANSVFTGNILAWDWSYVARSDITTPGIPEQQTGDQGQILGEKLLLALGQTIPSGFSSSVTVLER
jgi:hypothetical protein